MRKCRAERRGKESKEKRRKKGKIGYRRIHDEEMWEERRKDEKGEKFAQK